jgi:hypothetical protein
LLDLADIVPYLTGTVAEREYSSEYLTSVMIHGINSCPRSNIHLDVRTEPRALNCEWSLFILDDGFGIGCYAVINTAWCVIIQRLADRKARC